MPSAEDFPYDAAWEGREHQLRDLDKLRAVEDRRTAQWLYELWEHIEANRSRIEESIAIEQKLRERDELERLHQICRTALRGGFGFEAKRLAEELTQQGADQSRGCLEHLASELHRGGYQRV